MGLPKRMMNQFGQMNKDKVDSVSNSEPVKSNKPSVSLQSLSSMSERIDHIASEFDVKALPLSDISALQTSLTDSGLIQPTQVRAQGLLTQLAYRHYEAGPMNVEEALEDHVNTLKDKSAVLADHKESKQLLNTVRNLISAREQKIHAA